MYTFKWNFESFVSKSFRHSAYKFLTNFVENNANAGPVIGLKQLKTPSGT